MSFTGPFRRALLIIALLFLVTAAAADTNTIQIFVHPGSGNVCLDNMCEVDRGTLSGYSSTQFSGVAGGQQHTIRIESTDGYQDYNDQVYMDLSGHPMTFRIYLEPLPVQTQSPGTGSLQVTVSPGLGQVCLDNRECESSVGDPSMFWSVQFSDVPVDAAHTISVTADGYETYTQQVSILPDQRNDVDVTLQPLSQGTGPREPAQQSAPPEPQPTRAATGGAIALVAAGISSMAFLAFGHRK